MVESSPVFVRSNPRVLSHDPGLGHPESSRRVEVILDALEPGAAGRWIVDRQAPLPPDPEVIGALRWIHDDDYIERVRAASEEAHGWIDTHDCRISAGTFDAAVAAAGLAMNAALDMVNRRLERAFVVLRPPSHHAVFDRPEVGYVSVHAFPGFPGTGTADEIGVGSGTGTTRNVPLVAGADDSVFCSAFEEALDEVASRLRPAAIIVSAGFVAHASAPVGGMRVSEAGFRRLSSAVTAAAHRWSSGRVLSFLEGGFDLQALANCARIHVEELASGDVEKADA